MSKGLFYGGLVPVCFSCSKPAYFLPMFVATQYPQAVMCDPCDAEQREKDEGESAG